MLTHEFLKISIGILYCAYARCRLLSVTKFGANCGQGPTIGPLWHVGYVTAVQACSLLHCKQGSLACSACWVAYGLWRQARCTSRAAVEASASATPSSMCRSGLTSLWAPCRSRSCTPLRSLQVTPHVTAACRCAPFCNELCCYQLPCTRPIPARV